MGMQCTKVCSKPVNAAGVTHFVGWGWHIHLLNLQLHMGSMISD